jgi:hypothetical protein
VVEKNELKPWRVKHWNIVDGPSPQYVANMEDLLDLYTLPYDARYPVVCLDEKLKELHSTPHGEIPMEPGRAKYEDYEYKRQGSCNLFIAVEPLRGWRRVTVTEQRKAQDFAERLRQLVDEDYPDAAKIRLVTDNLNTHATGSLYKQFKPAVARRIASKIEWHYTPKHGSWLNIAECELSVLARQCLNRRMGHRETVAAETLTWQNQRNMQQVTIDWQFTAEDARIKLKRLYPVLKEQ